MEEVITKKVQKTIENYRMLKGVRRLLIAFSAGPDSVALLDILHHLYGKKIKFYIAYINHQIRPAAKKEEMMTRNYAKRYKVGIRIRRIDLRKIPMTEGLESAARELRYKSLFCLAEEVKAQKIVLAHNADDFLETFILNLIRGGGRLGLAGMPPIRGRIIRPLIKIRKDEILKYLRKKGLKYSFDRTNLSIRFRRNYIRRKIVPHLVRLNPDIHNTIFRSIEILQSEEEFLDAQTEQIFKAVSQISPDIIKLDRNQLFKYSIVLIRRVIRKALTLIKSDLHGIEFKHIDQIVSLGHKKTGKAIVLPQSLIAEREYDWIVIRKECAPPTDFLLNVPIGAKRVLPDCNIVITTRLIGIKKWQKIRQAPACTAYFDFDRLHLPLVLRNRKAGDFVIDFSGNRKKIKDIFIGHKIPRAERPRIPLLVDQKDILWIVGYARSNRALVTEATKKILVVKVENLNK